MGKATPGVAYGAGLNPVSEAEIQCRVDEALRRQRHVTSISVGCRDESPKARLSELQMRASVAPQFADGQLTRVGGASTITTTRDQSASTSILQALGRGGNRKTMP